MADTDEAAAHLPASQDSAPQIETDLSDETQDFRFLNNLALWAPLLHLHQLLRFEKNLFSQ